MLGRNEAPDDGGGLDDDAEGNHQDAGGEDGQKLEDAQTADAERPAHSVNGHVVEHGGDEAKQPIQHLHRVPTQKRKKTTDSRHHSEDDVWHPLHLDARNREELQQQHVDYGHW